MAKLDKMNQLENLNIINSDWPGAKYINNTHELVAYHNDTCIRIWRNTESIGYKPHWHSSIEIIMPVENCYDVKINNKDYHLNPNEILIIPPRELHELIAPPKGVRFIFLFNISVLTQLKGYAAIQSMLALPLHITKDTHPLIYSEVCQSLLEMCNEYASGNPYSELTIFSLLIKLLITLYENHIQTADLFQNVNVSKHQEYVSKFGNLLEYIDTHYTEDLTLEDMADIIGFSKYHFSRLFKQYTKFTFCDYLKHRRIQAAEMLLEQPEYSITEVALQSGFPSISTFNRIFKEQKNCTPTEYRMMKSKRKSHH
ncbi:MAG: AraC family transcriptional regulator [Lachnospiraceae bacterium]